MTAARWALVLAATLSSPACAAEVADGGPGDRAGGGKADAILGTCQPADCGGPAGDGDGFCDASCAGFGDCAADVRAVCGFDECEVDERGQTTGCDGGTCDEGLCVPDFAWGLNDVSVLFPTRPTDVPHLVGPVGSVDGNKVLLLDPALFDRLGKDAPFLTETPNRDKHYDKLKVTSFRLDPCVDGFDPHAPDCARAIRLVMQPIWPIGDAFDTLDASIHLFYELEEADWTSLISQVAALRTRDLSEAPLQVHPILVEQGVDSDFGRGLTGLIRRFATADRVTRMTFMATGRSGNNWFWGGFDRTESGDFERLEIPIIERDEDSFTQHGRDLVEPPVPPLEGFPTALLRNHTLDAMADDEVTDAIATLQEYENPTLTNATNLQCSFCHLAHEARFHALSRRGVMEPLGAPRYEPAAFFDEELVVEPPLDNRGKNMHGFSYFGDIPTISARVVHESAEVVGFLRRD